MAVQHVVVPELKSARISTCTCLIKRDPKHRSETTSELVFGESVLVMEHDAQWCKIRVARDGYEGYIETGACNFSPPTSTHWINTRATLLFEKPDIKSSVVQRLLFGSELSAVPPYGKQGRTNGRKSLEPEPTTNDVASTEFLELEGQGFVWSAHCSKIGEVSPASMIELALNHYHHAPYLWGGRSSDGCDCSGLVQMLAAAKGVSLPRDSGDQERALTMNVDYEDRLAEDLVYWPGHVGVLQTPNLLLHSTAHYMQCCVEPLTDVVRRAGTPTSIKRISHIERD